LLALAVQVESIKAPASWRLRGNERPAQKIKKMSVGETVGETP